MVKAKQTDENQEKLDINGILKGASNFVQKEFERSELPLMVKEDIEDTTFVVFDYKAVKTAKDTYYNFKCIDEMSKNPFCFNGSNILANQLDENGMPARVKLIRKERDDKLRPYYWVFTNPDI